MSQSKETHSNTSGFILGLLLGAIVGALVAILIYRNDKDKVFKKLKLKIDDFISKLIPSKISSEPTPKKIISKPLRKTTVKLPAKPLVEVGFVSKTPPSAPKRATPKTFIRAKK